MTIIIVKQNVLYKDHILQINKLYKDYNKLNNNYQIKYINKNK